MVPRVEEDLQCCLDNFVLYRFPIEQGLPQDGPEVYLRAISSNSCIIPRSMLTKSILAFRVNCRSGLGGCSGVSETIVFRPRVLKKGT
jgi:hypothetical protein